MNSVPAANAPVDLVYTWVDDSWPGYLDVLRAHARSAHDLNPNRTRDNLELMRYSLRSVAQHAPWIRNVHLLTCRPQIPRWLDTRHPALRVTHHDQIMDKAILPTFNSFAIITHLHKLPDLSDRFIYMEDDMLLGAPVTLKDFTDEEWRIRIYPRIGLSPAADTRDSSKQSPWNLCVARANHLLDQHYGRARRRTVNHMPLMIDRSLWADMLAEWPAVVKQTRQSRFRATGGIAPEYLYPHYARAKGKSIFGSLFNTYRESYYFPLENWYPLIRLHAAIARWRRPKFLTLNDNFGEQPDLRSVAYLRRALQRWFPVPSPYELPDPGR
jgi:hypothetical protein